MTDKPTPGNDPPTSAASRIDAVRQNAARAAEQGFITWIEADRLVNLAYEKEGQERCLTTPPPGPAASEYVVLRRCDVEALIEEHAIDEDPFWRPVTVATVTLPSCSCGSISLYAEAPPRLGPHHQASCQRWEPRR